MFSFLHNSSLPCLVYINHCNLYSIFNVLSIIYHFSLFVTYQYVNMCISFSPSSPETKLLIFPIYWVIDKKEGMARPLMICGPTKDVSDVTRLQSVRYSCMTMSQIQSIETNTKWSLLHKWESLYKPKSYGKVAFFV